MMPGATMRPPNDRETLALTIYGEARGESLDGKLAVASVIRNRLTSARWGLTYSTVCLAPKQFSCWNVDDVNLPTLRALGQSLTAGLAPEDKALRTCLWIADGTIANCFDSTVFDCTHYFWAGMEHPPMWARTGEYVLKAGSHLFYRNVP